MPGTDQATIVVLFRAGGVFLKGQTVTVGTRIATEQRIDAQVIAQLELRSDVSNPVTATVAEDIAALEENLDTLDLHDRSKVVAADAVTAAASIDADIVVADPPYDFDDWERLLARVSADLVVAESGERLEPVAGWTVTREKRYGRTRVTFLERQTPSAAVADVGSGSP